jgi:hypothetical protein
MRAGAFSKGAHPDPEVVSSGERLAETIFSGRLYRKSIPWNYIHHCKKNNAIPNGPRRLARTIVKALLSKPIRDSLHATGRVTC